MEMSRLTRDGTTAEPIWRDQILRRERGKGNIHFPCSADHEQDWQPYPVSGIELTNSSPKCGVVCWILHKIIIFILASITERSVKTWVIKIQPLVGERVLNLHRDKKP